MFHAPLALLAGLFVLTLVVSPPTATPVGFIFSAPAAE